MDSTLIQQLSKTQLLSDAVIDQLRSDAEKRGRTFIEEAMGDESITNGPILQCAAEANKMAVIDIARVNIEMLAIDTLSDNIMKKYQILALSRRLNRLYVAVGSTDYQHAIQQARFHTNLNITPILCNPLILKSIIRGLGSEQNTPSSYGRRHDDINLSELQFDDPDAPTDEEDHNAVDLDLNNPIVRYVDKILRDAIAQGASDIHIEPYEHDARIRYRIDGVLHSIDEPPLKLLQNIVSRIKVLARLDIAERRIPQDGRLKLQFSRTRIIDFRVSTIPALFGEKIVLRILDQSSNSLKLSTLGMLPKQLEKYEEATSQPHGMILVTGPTGSGKTVTLYSALDVLNTPDTNISSVEDPVEIYADGVNQVSINEKAGLTFAGTLRAFLRQDPDVLMVGEIRDLETADIATKAAQTGHLVLSTLHTNDAPSAITRLLNMGVAPFNISSTVNLIIAQRLVRILCDVCKTPVEIPQTALEYAGFSAAQIEAGTFFQPTGCRACSKGYKGRTGIFEMMPISAEVGELIMNNATEAQISRKIRKEGILTLRQEGIKKVVSGITSLAEVERVTKS